MRTATSHRIAARIYIVLALAAFRLLIRDLEAGNTWAAVFSGVVIILNTIVARMHLRAASTPPPPCPKSTP